ncbi:hypothetical protein [Aureivirga sp. CE67]|uniref:hypothetical protein n=1 Tax=Aureivirga sp. CE67 TaxID=1788983 RepID=UPI0018CA38A8|nr:hypothetical protein [Aureivirga sp. CE67]
MCKISEHLKFCTCNEKINLKENYWELKRRAKGFILGQLIHYPDDFDINKKTILKITDNLNSKNLFDFDYKPEEEDKLKLSFNKGEKESIIHFLFKNGKWERFYESGLNNSFDYLEDRDLYFPFISGKINNPFEDK